MLTSEASSSSSIIRKRSLKLGQNRTHTRQSEQIWNVRSRSARAAAGSKYCGSSGSYRCVADTLTSLHLEDESGPGKLPGAASDEPGFAAGLADLFEALRE